MKSAWFKAIIGLAAVIGAGEAQAGSITTYSSRPTFNTAVGGSLTVEDFTNASHFPISTGVLNSATNLPGIGIVPGMIQPGVTYSTPVGGGFFFNIDAGGGYPGGFLDGFNPSNRQLTVAFDSNVSAFGFDLGRLGAITFDVTIHFASGPDQLFSNAYPEALQFFGFQSSLTDITGATIANQGGFFGFDLDNFTFDGAAQTAVPSPAASILGLSGMGLLALRRNRRA